LPPDEPALRTIHVGLGPIGCEIARAALRAPGVEVAAAIDVDPAKAGIDLGTVLGLGLELGVVVSDDPEATLAEAGAGAVVLHSTGSRLAAVAGQLEQALAHGAWVVSTCEELSYPWLTEPELADRLDALASDHRVGLVGAGVNPGFVMDALPATLLTATEAVTAIDIRRVVDTASRRPQLRAKTGVGTTPTAFEEGVAAGVLGHVGLRESAHLVASAAGWRLESSLESIEPVLAAGANGAGERVIGVHQTVRGIVAGEERLLLNLTMAVGAPDPRDQIRIDGTPSLELVVPGGVAGDRATAANVLSCARRVTRAGSGLRTILDLPLAARSGRGILSAS